MPRPIVELLQLKKRAQHLLFFVLGLLAAGALASEQATEEISLPAPRVTLPALLTQQQPTIVQTPEIKDKRTAAPANNTAEPGEKVSEKPTEEVDLPEGPEQETELPAQTPTKNPQLIASQPITSVEQCLQAPPGNLRKTLLFTAFPRRPATNSNTGRIQQIEWQLPSRIAQHMANNHQLIIRTILAESFPATGPDQQAQIAQSLANKYDAQIIVSGEIVSTELHRPQDVHQPGFGTRMRSGLLDRLSLVSPHDTRHRQFTLNLSLHDGTTGQRILERRYHTTGLWNSQPVETQSLDSAQMAATDYGRAVSQLLSEASDELAQLIHCQPHLLSMEIRSHAQYAVLHGGANQGLRPGDQIQLYRMSKHAGRHYGHFHTTLTPTGHQGEIVAVYRDYSLLKTDIDTLFSSHYVALVSGNKPELAYQ